MKVVLFLFLVVFGLSSSVRAQMQDLPSPGDDLPLPPPPAPPDNPNPQPPQTPAPAPIPGRLAIGDQVLSGPFIGKQYYTGIVTQVSRDGRNAQVRDDQDGKIYQRDARLISKRMNCGPRAICAGDRVLVGPMTQNDFYYGTVMAVYERGLFLVRYDVDGRQYVRHESKVSKRLFSDSQINIFAGDRVLIGPFTSHPLYVMGWVDSIYENGTIMVREDGANEVWARKREMISPEVNCYKNICGGDDVTIGMVQFVFANGKFIVWEERSRIYQLRDYRDLRKK